MRKKIAERATTQQVSFIAPQLATLADSAPTGAGWLHETKFDGYRMLCYVANRAVTLISRNGLDWTDRFQTICDDLRGAIKSRHVVLDGEIVVNTKGHSSFHALQTALSNENTSKARLMLFDILVVSGVDVRSEPLSERRQALEALFEIFPDKSTVKLSALLRGPGAAALARACKNGEEGIVSKRLNLPYESGRSRNWLKIKCQKRQELVVVGYTDPKGGRTGIGALLLGVYQTSGQLAYAGRVGTGFNNDELGALRGQLEKLGVNKSALHLDAERGVRERNSVHWVRPKLVAEISFTEWTVDGLLRHPVFQGLREDKKATDVRRED